MRSVTNPRPSARIVRDPGYTWGNYQVRLLLDGQQVGVVHYSTRRAARAKVRTWTEGTRHVR